MKFRNTKHRFRIVFVIAFFHVEIGDCRHVVLVMSRVSAWDIRIQTVITLRAINTWLFNLLIAFSVRLKGITIKGDIIFMIIIDNR